MERDRHDSGMIMQFQPEMVMRIEGTENQVVVSTGITTKKDKKLLLLTRRGR